MLMSCFDLSYFIVFVVYLGSCITFIMFTILVFFTWCRLCTITATDTVTMAIDSTRSTTTMILKSRRLVDVLYYSYNLFNVTNFHLTKKLSCSKTRWQVKKINYSIVSTKYWFCITYCSTNRTTIQLFYVWWIQWSVIGCNLTFTCKKKENILFTRIDQRGYINIWFYIKCKDLSSPFLRKFVFLIPMTLAWC